MELRKLSWWESFVIDLATIIQGLVGLMSLGFYRPSFYIRAVEWSMDRMFKESK